MINRIVLVGRLTADPTLRYTPSGVAVATFTLAVNRQFANAQGEKEADFINCVAWRQLAELCANYLKKGSLCAVEGRLQVRSYEKDNKRVYITEVVCENVQFLSQPNTQGNRENANTEQSGNPSDPFGGSTSISIPDDDLPFSPNRI